MLVLQIFISFIAGGIFIALQTIAGERVPARWRGIVLTIPSTMALGLFFIGLTKSAQDVPDVIKIIPATMGIVYIFTWIFAYFSKYDLVKAFVSAFLFWGFGAFMLLHFPPKTLSSSIVFYAVPMIAVSYFLIKNLSQEKTFKPVPLTLNLLLARSVISGSIIALVIILAKTMGNNWGGIFSTFPAAFSATLIIYFLAHGKNVIPSVAKSLFFPGAFGFTLYAIIASYSYPKFGIWVGAIVPYFIILPFYYFYSRIKSKIRPN